MLISCYFILLIFKTSNSKILLDDKTDNYSALTDCALLVTKDYISPKINTLVVQELCSNYKGTNHRLLENFLQRYNGATALQLSYGQHFELPWKYYVFIVDELVDFKKIRLHISYTKHESELHFLIILVYTEKQYQLREHKKLEIFRICLDFKILHVVIMEQEYEHDENINLYTYSFSGANCGQRIDMLQTNRFRNGILENNRLFSPQPKNLNGCSLNVSAYLFLPWVGFNGDPENVTQMSDINRLTGVDGINLRLLSEILNFKVKLRFRKQKGVINMNENSTEGYVDLETLKADISIGGSSAAFENRSKLTASIAYRYTPFVFVVRSDLHFGSLEQLANPFQPAVWIAIVLIMLLASALIKIIYHEANGAYSAHLLVIQQQYTNTNLISILLGNPIKSIPPCNPTRFLLISWLLFALILRNAYQGKLFDSMRVSRRIPIPKTFTELVQNDYKLLSSTYVSYYPENLTIIFTNVEQQFNEILNSEEKLTSVATLDTLGYYNYIQQNISSLTYVSEPLYTFYLSMHFQKNSILQPIFDIKIRQLLYSGITKHLTAKQVVRQDFQTMNVGNTEVQSITNKTLSGLYRLCGISIGITIFIFVLEMISVKTEKLRNFFVTLHN